MQLAAKFIYYNSTVDSSMKPNETIQQRFDKALEEFYAICDQIESNLVLAAECHGQFIDSNRHFQILVASGNKTEQGSQYGQYLATVKTQISFAKELHDALLECVSRMSTKQ
ncbi:PREDICTED: mediator of RNA polymerase II transcription subunit 29-like [Priapulus caudatus]|uniref:Mediator of RNA polymerase II transcription subunit 29 n=1 Tax=Priapulus caudatus TaxID=37621 RepID=A0ABM1EVQ8_PRICU|nr:PREDICTED: mediator of RNA polymerase II transcription subunit 29-like [Priapulus caudatus]